MKRWIILCIALCLLLCACGTADSQEAEVAPEIQVEGVNQGKAIDQEDLPEGDDMGDDDIVTVHYNPNNIIFEDNEVTIRPRYVYWEGDVLVTECFVLNGTDHEVYNISVPSLVLSNEDGVIVDGGFGTLNNLTLASMEYAVWTFRFSGDAVERAGADLNYLRTKCSVRYSP